MACGFFGLVVATAAAGETKVMARARVERVRPIMTTDPDFPTDE
jgi:hypothetical protein